MIAAGGIADGRCWDERHSGDLAVDVAPCLPALGDNNVGAIVDRAACGVAACDGVKHLRSTAMCDFGQRPGLDDGGRREEKRVLVGLDPFNSAAIYLIRPRPRTGARFAREREGASLSQALTLQRSCGPVLRP